MSAVNNKSQLPPQIFDLFGGLIRQGGIKFDDKMKVEKDRLTEGRFPINEEEKRFSPYQCDFSKETIRFAPLLNLIGELFAKKIDGLGIEFDMVYITDSSYEQLAITTVMKLWELFEKNASYGGYKADSSGKLLSIGDNIIKGKRIVLITSYAILGQSLFTTFDNITRWEGKIVATVALFDCKEKTGANNALSPFQHLRLNRKIPITAITSISDLMTFFKDGSVEIKNKLQYILNIKKYLSVWGEPQLKDLSDAFEKKCEVYDDNTPTADD